jgi:hypothetical protein
MEWKTAYVTVKTFEILLLLSGCVVLIPEQVRDDNCERNFFAIA